MKKEILNFANMLSLSRVFFGLVFLFLFYYYINFNLSNIAILIIEILSLVVFIIAIITDALDGYFARKNNNVTNFGKHLDPLTDSIFFIIVFFTFLILKLMPLYFFVPILFRELFMHIFFRPFFISKGQSLPANIYGKIKTIFQSIFSIMILTILILKQLLIILINLNENTIITYNFYLNITAYIFFSIITFLSLLSLTIYIIQSKKILIKGSN